ncbi:conserved hypothetical protein [Ricinus communis]|uniref:Uncharacterized protein n=1 Tax=Ricinus communis TaxID=3988 RepID=B9TJW5_RICCO|nr:conserved hypothetical protein [Ricinus communis]
MRAPSASRLSCTISPFSHSSITAARATRQMAFVRKSVAFSAHWSSHATSKLMGFCANDRVDFANGVVFPAINGYLAASAFVTALFFVSG